MTELGERIHSYIDGEDSVRLLAKYYGGRYTGSRFDTADELQSPDPYRFTAHDFASMATLSVPLSGPAVVGLLERETQLAALLSDVPRDVDLSRASDDELAAVFSVQRALDDVHDIGPVTRSKLLAHKRPRLVPIRDQHVLIALVGHDRGSFTEPLRDALKADPSIEARLAAVQVDAAVSLVVSALRALDVIVWMAAYGDRQVSD